MVKKVSFSIAGKGWNYWTSDNSATGRIVDEFSKTEMKSDKIQLSE
jgi:hypothetical protein